MTGDMGSAACGGGQPAARAEGACGGQETPHHYFSHMIGNCLRYAQASL